MSSQANGGKLSVDLDLPDLHEYAIPIAKPATESEGTMYTLRTIPIFVARMSQKARDACAIVLLVNACTGVVHGAGDACDPGGTNAAPKAYEQM